MYRHIFNVHEEEVGLRSILLYYPNRVALAKDSDFRRVPPRKPQDRQENYLEMFDFDTVFSDVFVRDGRLWMVGPPFANLEPELKISTFKWNMRDVSSEVEFENLNRMSRASVPVDASNGLLEIAGPLGAWKFEVNELRDDLFYGSNLLITQQKNNRLEWIAYWAFFNAQVNGVDSVIIYDNCSDNYTAEKIDQILARTPGIQSHVVVKWDTPYGATGGPNSVWDSDYGQHISWEHARRAFASSAASCCVIDIDELPFSSDGTALVDKLAASDKAAMFFNRQPIRQFPNRRSESGSSLRTHADFSLGEVRGAWLAPKYIYAPARLPKEAQLMVHVIRDLGAKNETEKDVQAGHFDSIRIRWRNGETQQVKNFEHEDQIKEPVEIVSALDEHFDRWEVLWKELESKLKPIFELQA